MESSCTGSRHRPVSASCTRRSLFTHRETLTREPALAPAPGTALRSRESRPRRICAVDLALGVATQNSIRNQLCWRWGATWTALERPYRAEGALSMRAPEDVVEIGLYCIPTDDGGTRCARRSWSTHRETVARELALAPAPGKHLRSAQSRRSRISALDPAIGGRTHTQSRASCAGVVWAASSLLFAPKAHFR